MSENYTEMCHEIKNYVGKFYKEMPNVMEGFGNLTQSASKDGDALARTRINAQAATNAIVFIHDNVKFII